MSRKNLITIMVLVFVSLAVVYADGLFVQSPVYSHDVEYSFASQLGIELSEEDPTAIIIPENTVLQAIGDSEYPVTPGDVFSLVYSDGRNVISLELQADSDCKVMIQNIGSVDAAGMTYRTFKAHVESLISTYYTFSSPQLQLKSCGVYSVRISGEVVFSQFVTCWGLTRLSDLATYATKYASTREIQIKYRDGSVKSYDLFKALRNGSFEDNPLLAPGCEVIFKKASAIVSLSGAVKNEGVYQMEEGQTLFDLITVYGEGLLSSADSQSIMVANYLDGSYVAKYLTIEDAKGYIPANGDVVTAVYNAQNAPYVSITGAITATEGSTSLSMANSADYRFTEGETAMQLLAKISSMILSTGDVSSAYILRDGKRIAIDSSDAVLQVGDNIIIPFSRQTVTVTGYVNNPGTFAYVPGMTSDYYIALAGGFSGSSSGRVKVIASDGSSANGKVVPAGATITAKNNNLTTNLTITASVVSLISSILLMITYGHTISTYF